MSKETEDGGRGCSKSGRCNVAALGVWVNICTCVSVTFFRTHWSRPLCEIN